MNRIRFSLAAATAIAALSLSACQDAASTGGAGGGTQSISIVGSSTVFPFAKQVAERFGQETEFGTPVLESTGTGGGIEQFCAGIGGDTPSISNASRRMKGSELETCQQNGVQDVVEVTAGIDGIAIAQSTESDDIALTPKQIYEALAANPYGEPQTAKNWSDVDPSLPSRTIAVYGPPTTSGTRDAFNELMMTVGCEQNPKMAALKESDKDQFEEICTSIRTDGGYIEQGENDNLIVQKLTSNPDHLGIFGYSYMEENAGRVEGVAINGVSPTFDTIASGEYPGARRLYFYVKKAHVGKVPGIAEYVKMFVDMAGENGPLTRIGLIPLPKSDYDAQEQALAGMTPLTASDLK